MSHSSRRKRNTNASATRGETALTTRAQTGSGGRGGAPGGARGGSRSGQFLAQLPANTGYYPMPPAVAPYAPGQAYQGQSNSGRGGNFPGQNVSGDNSMPVDAYGPQYMLVPVMPNGLPAAGAQTQQDSANNQGSQNNQNSQGSQNAPVIPRPIGPRQPAIFPPGDPIRPVPNIGIRQYPYTVGTNISTAPRVTEVVDFTTLRNLAQYCYGVTLCETTIFRIFRRAQLQITPKKAYLSPDDDPSAAKWQTPGLQMQEWFEEGPDKRGHDLTHWMVQAMRELLEIDALGLYPVPTRGGGLYALDIIAGDTIAPRIDDAGRVPYPPLPAYQQVVWGAPGFLFMQASGKLNGFELDYLLMNPQATSPYGVPPVQQILLTVNTLLRKGEYDLQRFTSGSTPEGVIETQQQQLFNMTQDEVQLWQDAWNGLLAGNSALRVRTQFVPPGFTFKPTRPESVQTDFDRFLLNIAVATFGLTMDEIGFTETSNRATGSAQEAVVYRNAVQPYTQYFSRYFSRNVIARYDGQPLSPVNAFVSTPGSPAKTRGVWDKRYAASWGGIEEPDDWSRRVNGYVQLGKAGYLGGTEIKRLLGIPAVPGEVPIPPFVALPGGPGSIAFIEDLVGQRDKLSDANDAALDAKIASSKQVVDAMNNPQPAPGTPGAPGTVPGTAGATGATNPIAAQALAAGKPQQAQQAASGGKPAQPAQPTPSPQVQQQVAAKGQALQAQAQAKAQRGNATLESIESLEQEDEQGDIYADRVYADPRGPAYDESPDRVGAGAGRLVDSAGLDPLGSLDRDAGTTAGSPTASEPTAAAHPPGRGDGLYDAGGNPATARPASSAGSASGGSTISASSTISAATSTPSIPASPEEVSAEWRRYRERALKAVKQGRQVTFVSEVLPQPLYGWVATQLQRATTPDAVRAIFAEAKEREDGRTEGAQSPTQRLTGMNSDDFDTTIWLMFKVPAPLAEQLAVPGGEKPEVLHITVAFLGEKDTYTPAQLKQLRKTVAGFVEDEVIPTPATITGVQQFPPSAETNNYAVYASIESPHLAAWRDRLVATLTAAGFPVDKTFSTYVPHVTLAYVAEGKPSPVKSVPHVSFPLDTLWLHIGEDQYAFRIGTEQFSSYWEHKDQTQRNSHDRASTDDPLQRLADALAARVEATTQRQIANSLRESRTLVLQAIGSVE